MHANHMQHWFAVSVNVQIRNVPDDTHRRLKAQAARSGKSLSEYLREEVLAFAERPTMGQWLSEVARNKPVDSVTSAADLIQDERAGR